MFPQTWEYLQDKCRPSQVPKDPTCNSVHMAHQQRICLPIAARCRPQPGAWKSSPLPMAPLPQSMVDGQPPRDHNIHTRMPLVPGWEVGKRLSPISSPTKYTMELPAQGKSAYHFALLPDAMGHKLTMNLPCLLTCHYLGQRVMVECYPQHPPNLLLANPSWLPPPAEGYSSQKMQTGCGGAEHGQGVRDWGAHSQEPRLGK